MTSSSGNTDLVETTDTTLTIPTLASGSYSSPSDFPVNHWGYKKDSGSYIPFATNTTILESDTYANDDTTTLSFATKIDYLQASGTYKTTLVFTTTANPLSPNMQNLDPTLCTTTPLTVLDKRDDQEYIIQRLADGNCWMLDNLRLGSVALTESLSTANTNMSPSVAFTLPTPSSTVNNYTAPVINITDADTVASVKYGIGSGKIGVHYNYCAATAGTFCYASGSGSGVANYDICPAGWRLPTGGSGGEFPTLAGQYPSTTATNTNSVQYNLSTPLSGYYSPGMTEYGVAGSFLASVQYNGSYSHGFYVTSSTTYPLNSNNRKSGFSIRCVLKDTRTISDITNMQDITPGIVSRTANGATTTLKDTRDGQEYTVAKINGNVWMTRNLAIGCNGAGSNYGSTITSTTITNTNSNISASTWTTPTNSLTLGDSYTDPRMECNSSYGAWYNYAAASAGTITGTSNSTNGTYDVCPAGWKLPTYSELQSVSSYTTQLNTGAGGFYYGGVTIQTEGSLFWSATAYNATIHYALGGTGAMNYNPYNVRYSGNYLRCIAKY